MVFNLVYLLVLAAASPIILWRMVRHGKYLEGFREKFLGLAPRTPETAGPVFWLHAVSVGEVNLLKPLIPRLREAYPRAYFAVSSTSLTGYRLAKKLFGDLTVFYSPLDWTWSVRRALRRVRPDCLLLAELELWPNLIGQAARRGVKTAIFNGRISEKSFKKYKLIKFAVRPLLRKLSLVAASGEEAARYFLELGADPERLVVTGSIKFDGVQTDRQNPKTLELARLAGIRLNKEGDRPADLVFLAGSTQEPEEAMALDVFGEWFEKFPNLKLILVPRHPERFEAVARLLDASRFEWTRRSELTEPAKPGASRILLVDTVGELGAWWGTASVAFVGGSMGKRGGQNMLEPAAYGAAVCFGPNTKNFKEISQRILRCGGAKVVRNGAELNSFVGQCLTDPDYARELGNSAADLVVSQRGACKKTVDAIKGILPF